MGRARLSGGGATTFFSTFCEVAGAGGARLTSATGAVTELAGFLTGGLVFFVAKEFLQCPIKICVKVV
jgi:hypothetical protein